MADQQFRIGRGSIAKFQKTPEGYARMYVRKLSVDTDLTYYRADGVKRVETIKHGDAFDLKALEYGQMSPLTDGHPPGNYLDSSTADRYSRGSTHPQYVEEVTPFGTFLGQVVSVHSKDLVEKIESGQRPDVSPGYTLGALVPPNQGEHRWQQKGRKENHLASVSLGRGQGASVQFAGIRGDSADGEIWTPTQTIVIPGVGEVELWCEECRGDAVDEVPLPSWLDDALASGGHNLPLLTTAAGTAHNLDRVKLRSDSAVDADDLYDSDEDDEGTGKKGCGCSTKKAGSDKPCGCDKRRNKKTKKRVRSDSPMVRIKVHGVPVEVDEAAATQLEQALSNNSAVIDDLRSNLAEAEGKRGDSASLVEQQAEQIEELQENLIKAGNAIEQLMAREQDYELDEEDGLIERRADGAVGVFMTDDELMGYAVGAVELVDSFRADAAALRVDLVSSYRGDSAVESGMSEWEAEQAKQRVVIENLLGDSDDFRRSMITQAANASGATGYRGDSVDEANLADAYERELFPHRNAAMQAMSKVRGDAAQRQQNVRADSAAVATAPARQQQIGGALGQSPYVAQLAALNSVGASPAVSQVKTMGKAFAEQQDAAYEQFRQQR